MNNINVDLSSWIIDQNEIHDFLNNLDINASTGPDGVPSIILKLCSFKLIKPLHLIFNKSLSIGNFPNIWKKSFITPIHKSGDKHNVSNCRPISKLSQIPKIFDAIITKKSKILDSLNNQAQSDSIYTNFQKAFDKINHSLLLNKLVSFGIHGSFFILDKILY
ncbi:putative RNA-directed DNA polymerase [Aphis craccivora]|uniref:Putative RNA-directed DNA polymerase n=1 Tax=Aphis craccivora TaxID=307492 RepID=A0A6G0ZLQ7_APHCR|nr:putative RNA-directed DNA polymerase [Aphis craccivora]